MSQLKLACIVIIGAITSLTLWLLKIAFALWLIYGCVEVLHALYTHILAN